MQSLKVQPQDTALVVFKDFLKRIGLDSAEIFVNSDPENLLLAVQFRIPRYSSLTSAPFVSFLKDLQNKISNSEFVQDQLLNEREKSMSTFKTKYGSGETYKAYEKIEKKLTREFQQLTFDLMIENYIRLQMSQCGLESDRTYQAMKNTWRYLAEELGVQRDYPYDVLESFPIAHPFAQDASVEAKRLLGIDL